MNRPLITILALAALSLSPAHARRGSSHDAWNRLVVSSGPFKAWNRLPGLSYRYLVHAYDPSGQLLWQRTESHLIRRLPEGLELRVQYRDRDGRTWILVRGPSRRWVTCDDAPRDWTELPADFRTRLAVDLFALEHPFCLRARGTTVRYVGLGRVRGRDCQSFEVVYPPSEEPLAARARLDVLHPSGWIHRLRFLPVDGKGVTWNVHFDQQLRSGPFRIPLRRELQIDGVLWRKTVLTDMVLGGRFEDALFRAPGHPLR